MRASKPVVVFRRDGNANVEEFSHVQGTLGRGVLDEIKGIAGAAGATGSTSASSGDFYIQFAGGNSYTGRQSRQSLLDAMILEVSEAAKDLFKEGFVGARAERNPDGDSSEPWTILVEVKQPEAVRDEIAMEDTFYARIAHSGLRRVNALLDFRSA